MIVGALLVRNEAAPDRYLRQTLANMAQFCDQIVGVDDHSTDDTKAICRASEKVVVVEDAQSEPGWWKKDETAARAQLWDLAAKHGDWVYVADADHELLGITPTEFRKLCTSQTVNGWACPLWDCWDSPDQQRVDGYWVAWRSPRVWLAQTKPLSGFLPSWSGRNLHAGHLPINFPGPFGLMPHGPGIAHRGYIRPEHRALKARKYLAVA